MDVAGTVSAASPPMTFVIDTQPPPPPQVTGISPDTGKSNDGITTAHNLTISGTAQAGNLVAVLINGDLVGCTMAGSNGAWTFDDTATTLPNGNYAITAVAVDVAGNFSNVSGAFNATVETVGSPTIAGASLITGDPGSPARHQQGLSIVGTAPSNDQVQVYLGGTLLGTVNVNGQGAWNYTYAPTSTDGPRRDLQLLGRRDGPVGERQRGLDPVLLRRDSADRAGAQLTSRRTRVPAARTGSPTRRIPCSPARPSPIRSSTSTATGIPTRSAR